MIQGRLVLSNPPERNHESEKEEDELTSTGSSKKVNKKSSNNSSEFSILSAYCPTIQIIAAFASGVSSASKFSHKVPIIPSYWFG